MVPALDGKMSLASLRKGTLRFKHHQTDHVEEFSDDELSDFFRQEIWKWPPRVIKTLASIFRSINQTDTHFWQWSQGLTFIVELCLEDEGLRDRLVKGESLPLPFQPSRKQLECASDIVRSIYLCYEDNQDGGEGKEDCDNRINAET